MSRLANWLLLGAALHALPAGAETWEVRMLTRGAEGAMVYEPDHLRIAAGDTVRFLPTQSGHNAASLSGLLPEGAEAFKSPLNKPFEQTFSVPGLYGIQCIPHLAMGMVMLIQVGEPGSQVAVPQSLPERARERFAAQLQKLQDGH